MKRKAKKILAGLCLGCLMMMLFSGAVLAGDKEPEFYFQLMVNGSEEIDARPGDIVTVSFTLQRTDAAEPYTMYGMQNEIRYDGRFFQLVEGSTLVKEGVETRDIALRDHNREFYMNYVSFSGGEKWDPDTMVGSFQLKVIGESGSGELTCQDYLVSRQDGNGEWKSKAGSAKIRVSTDCQVEFETYGGSVIEPVAVPYGEKLKKPADPIYEGHHLTGWYRDMDLKTEWNFEEDAVTENMILYAAWEEGDPTGHGRIWILVILAVLMGLGGTVLFKMRSKRKG